MKQMYKNRKVIKGIIILNLILVIAMSNGMAQDDVLYKSYKGLVMCGYQGWFRAIGDNANVGWGHFGNKGKFDPEHLTIDIYPDMSEYEKTYSTAFVNKDGSTAHIFSSVDESTTDLHFKWMKEYGIDGVFMQRFFDYTRNKDSRKIPDLVLKNAQTASQKYERAFAVMYDLSGLNPDTDDCSTIIEDWKHLVDQLQITNFGEKNNYLHHNEKPLVAIWGIGFPDRPYNIRNIKLERLIDFLKHDPVYGGCSIMLGVPTYFRQLDSDCVSDDYLHYLIRKADIVMPWMVGRFTLDVFSGMNFYRAHVKKDLKWSKENGVDYVPCVYPGFSWGNLSRVEFDGKFDYEQIPRYGGKFFWNQIYNVLDAGAKMIYVAMFDEVDEATAIFKCTDSPPVNARFINMDGFPSDHYLKLTGKASKILKEKQLLKKNIEELNKPCN
ncbi:hypothetical protein SAMN05444274_11318 [Mariniphaga anaerophila]|uniref:Xylosidase n=1 Tax=Mariniphaga anaerophila TaxID=1484053 RepID=A0A1M5FKD3_9BACT|nr:glycoside hydrolase family 71/99-like protein [Mariniphaga anaerophila]SHF91945.1 hypothetical protein SAMN05444274_11318 [Mariniphaga anaerophila]